MREHGAILMLQVLLLVNALAGAGATAAATGSEQWDEVTRVLQEGVDGKVFPGAVALVADRTGVLYQHAVGSLTYGKQTPLGQANAALTMTNVFDMASCTKVVATTSAVALLFQRGVLGPAGLDTPIHRILGKEFSRNGKEPISIRNCLLHNAGFPPDPTPFDYWDPRFGCVGAPLQANVSFACSERIYAAFLNQGLRPGARVGGEYVYSDLSFITLMYVSGRVALDEAFVSSTDFLPSCGSPAPGSGLELQCAYEAFVRLHVLGSLQMKSSGFRPAEAQRPSCVPTTVPTGEKIDADLQGQVEDGNSYNMGGIAGHAGLFSTAKDLSTFMRSLMFPETSPTLLNASTVALFIRQANHSQSSRALGWNTNDITAQPDGGWDESCGALSKETFTHVGYTGTQLCGDPVRGIYTILLTARVYGGDGAGSAGIHRVRKAFNTAVSAALPPKVQGK